MLGIICALASEAPRLTPEMRARAVVVVGGVGGVNAALAANRLVERHKLSGLISAGFAGALSPELAVGDLVLDTDDAGWSAMAERHAARAGRVVTVDHVVTRAAERQKLASRTGAIAVDMESSAVAGVAAERGLRFASVRAITDTAAHDLALDFNACRRADGNFDTVRLVLLALRTPRGIAELRQLWYASRLASQRLRAFLGELLNSC